MSDASPHSTPPRLSWLDAVKRNVISDRYERQYRVLGPAVALCMYVFEIVAGFCMVVLLAVALLSIFEAVLVYFGWLQADEYANGAMKSGLAPATRLLVSIVKGIELIFLAPLPFLLTVGIGKYADEVLLGSPTKAAKNELQTVKSFTAALFISVTTAHAVQEIVQGSVQNIWYFAGIVALILVLVFYLLILEKFSD